MPRKLGQHSEFPNIETIFHNLRYRIQNGFQRCCVSVISWQKKVMIINNLKFQISRQYSKTSATSVTGCKVDNNGLAYPSLVGRKKVMIINNLKFQISRQYSATSFPGCNVDFNGAVYPSLVGRKR